jgi:hypothetical protein
LVIQKILQLNFSFPLLLHHESYEVNGQMRPMTVSMVILVQSQKLLGILNSTDVSEMMSG